MLLLKGQSAILLKKKIAKNQYRAKYIFIKGNANKDP